MEIIEKVEKQGESSAPTNVLVDNFNPYNSANGLNQGLNCPLKTIAGMDDCPCFSTFITMIPIDCKITIFPYIRQCL